MVATDMLETKFSYEDAKTLRSFCVLRVLGPSWRDFWGGILKILVCVKQVADSGDVLGIDERTGWVALPSSSALRMNRFDEFALEEALLIKESIPGSFIDAVTVGPDRVCSALDRALGMGADHAIHILDPAEGYVSPFSVASMIAACARSRGYDLVITGAMAEDTMGGQTGQLIAALLDLPCATSVIRQEVHAGEARILVDREIEGGGREAMLLEMPAVLSIQPGIHLPRYPSFSKVMRARTYQKEIIRAGDLVVPEPREVCRGVHMIAVASEGIFLEGSTREKAQKLVRILHDKSFLA